MSPRLPLLAGAFAALAALVAPGAAHAATSAAFPLGDGGVRSAALGGHLVVLPVDDLALETNPARLVYAPGSVTVQYDHINSILGLSRGRIGASYALGPNVAEPYQGSQPYRMVVGASIANQQLDLIAGSRYRETTFTAGVGYAPFSVGAAGVAVRYQRSDSDVLGTNATGFAVDIGLSVDLSDHFDAALSVSDAFGRTTFEDSDDEDRAARTTLGIATARRRLWQAELDYVFQYDETSALAGGFEFHVLPGTLDLRVGVSQELVEPARMLLSAGAGVQFRAFHLDYAFRSDEDGAFDVQHRFALGARF